MSYKHVTVESAAKDMGEGPWWVAHEFPERKPDEWVLWDWSCDGCMIHLQAAVGLGNSDNDWMTVDADDLGAHASQGHTLSEVLEEAMAWRAEQGLHV